MEALIKIIALDKAYFHNNWNIFDFSIVIGAAISQILLSLDLVNIGMATTSIRTFRVCRIFRIIKRAKNLQAVFNTFLLTLPALINVGSLLLLILYLYCTLGIFLYSQVKLNGAFQDGFNFQSF